MSTYQYGYLPIIVVYTQATKKKLANNVLESLKNFLGENNNKIQYIKILAREDEIEIDDNKFIKKPAFGLDDLKTITIKSLSQTLNSSLYTSIKVRVVNLYKNNIKQKYEKIKIKLIQ